MVDNILAINTRIPDYAVTNAASADTTGDLILRSQILPIRRLQYTCTGDIVSLNVYIK